MEIERLTISNFRGVNGKLELEPNGENVVLVGPNGCGKSSVIAAVDFLFTGSIQELSGEGAGKLSEKRHGPHVDADPEDAWVEATFEVDGVEVTVRRELSDRNDPVIEADDDEVPDRFDRIADAADRGLHLLSRDELLDFITAQDGTRSERIRTLLDLYHVKDRRLALANASDHFQTKADRLVRESKAKRSDLRKALNIESDDVRALKRVNELRSELGGEPIDDPRNTSFQEDMESPSERVVASPLLRSNGRQHISDLQEWIGKGADEFLDADAEYRRTWASLDADKETMQALDRRQFIETGKDAVDPDTGRCPLCLKSWDPDKLQEHLDERLEKISDLQDDLEEIESQRDRAQQLLTNVRLQAESLHEVLTQIDRFDEGPLAEFVETISEWEDEYDGKLIDEPPKNDRSDDERQELLTPDDLQSLLADLQSHVDDQPDLDELESTWSTLGDADTRYDEMIDTSREAAEYQELATHMHAVHETFIEARDAVLERIYEEIEEEFEHYYTTLHEDESAFSMDLSPTETGLDLAVDFFERGQYPPHALHSEGHQDSMGICLYFALCNWLQEQEDLSVMMLDDVVMSIDEHHRRPLANLLASEIADDFQLFITTHDDLWHRHLRSSGVVSSSQAIQFSGWSINDGPQMLDRPEMEWETISELLDEGNTSMAAHQTRRMAEWYLREACDRLDGKVPFKANSKWTLGDFKNGVVSRYKRLVRKAKVAEESWGREIDHLEALEDEITDLGERIDHDGRALNPNVHYNEDQSAFANCTAEELKPAVEAYRDLYDLLWCGTCHSCISVAKEGLKDVNVSCNCSDTNMNLKKKV